MNLRRRSGQPGAVECSRSYRSLRLQRRPAGARVACALAPIRDHAGTSVESACRLAAVSPRTPDFGIWMREMRTSRGSFHVKVETLAVPGRLTQCGRTRRVAPEPECAESSAGRRHVLVQGAGWSMSVADAGLSTCCPPDPMSNARLRHLREREGVLGTNMGVVAVADPVVGASVCWDRAVAS